MNAPDPEAKPALEADADNSGADNGDGLDLAQDAFDEPEAPDGADGAGADSPPPTRRIAIRGRGGRTPSAERLYIAYDIADQKRWRRVFRTMKGYGRWLQLSVFQCRLSGRRRAELGATLDRLIHHKHDHIVILDLGLADEVDPRVESIGKSFTPITREAIVV